MKTRRTVASVAGTTLLAAGLAVLPAASASAAAWWPNPTHYCNYRVTATGNLIERDGPGQSYQADALLLDNHVYVAGQDGTINAEGFTWRRLADTLGEDHGGGFAAAMYLRLVPGTCVG